MDQDRSSNCGTVTSVVIPWHSLDARPVTAAIHAIEISRWCKEQGLVLREDFDWYYHPEDLTVTFNFYNGATSFASLCALKWM